jgi:uncharacterized membrane protein
MGKTRLEAFSDGVIAILITIMVLELKCRTARLARAAAARAAVPHLRPELRLLGIYWNNHHHMLHATARSRRVLWANLHLLFWLSLVPFVTGWMGENHFAPLPTASTASCCSARRSPTPSCRRHHPLEGPALEARGRREEGREGQDSSA